MNATLLTVVTLYLGVVACVAGAAAAGFPCATAARTGLVVAEILLVVQLVIDLVTLLRGHRPSELGTHLGYATVSVLLLPLLALRALRRPARIDHGVTAVAALVAIVVSVRLHATWAS